MVFSPVVWSWFCSWFGRCLVVVWSWFGRGFVRGFDVVLLWFGILS
jgi:hypothetical protein